MACDSYMRLLPHITTTPPPLRLCVDTSVRHPLTSCSCLLLHFLLPEFLSRLWSCCLCLVYGLSCYSLSLGLWEFHYRSLFNFHADLHASLDTHKESHGAGRRDELLVWARNNNSFFFCNFFTTHAWQQCTTNLANVDKAFTMHFAPYSSSLNISFHWKRVPCGLYKCAC